jgi:hypothetical protein
MWKKRSRVCTVTRFLVALNGSRGPRSLPDVLVVLEDNGGGSMMAERIIHESVADGVHHSG